MEKYRVKPGSDFKLSEYDPDDVGKYEDQKDEAVTELVNLRLKLAVLQEVLYAEHRQKILVVFQAMDTGGKDGTISHVFEGVNPQGIRVASFKVPTPIELDHDYLWRVHAQVPGKGELVIFNRSHYEDVLVVRVHKMITEEVCKDRYEQIRAFERILAETGTTILKFYLHIDKDEQKQRLEDRLKEPDKRWKFNPGDLEERKLWGDYMKAYEDAIRETSTDWAPWYVIPANHKWYAHRMVAEAIVDKLESLKMEYPKPAEDLSKYVIE